jgi:hypothetical protein
VKVAINVIGQAISELEHIDKRLEGYIDVLYSQKDKVAYVDGIHETISQIDQCITNLDIQKKNIISIKEAIISVVGYMERCENDCVDICYDDVVRYLDKERGIVDLTSIKKLLKNML